MTPFERLVLSGLYILVLRLLTLSNAKKTAFEGQWLARVEKEIE